MTTVNIHIDPLTTQGVLAHLGQAIDEIKLLRAIDCLKQQLYTGEAVQIDFGRRRYLVAELRYLNLQLESLRKQAIADGCQHGLSRHSHAAI
jgi:hypothetical protein